MHFSSLLLMLFPVYHSCLFPCKLLQDSSFLFSPFFSTSPDSHYLILLESSTWGIFYFLHYTAKPIWASYRFVLSIYRILFAACHYYPFFFFLAYVCYIFLPWWIIRKIFSSFSLKKLEHCDVVCSRSFSYRINIYQFLSIGLECPAVIIHGVQTSRGTCQIIYFYCPYSIYLQA